MKSPLKWPGNKYNILGDILPYLPLGRRLVEPFMGSGAVFLNTDYPAYLLGDVNPHLINFYHMLNPEFVDKARFEDGSNEKSFYLSCREEFNQTEDRFTKAKLFLYLNKHGYNGLVRYNLSGGYNVPFGQHKRGHYPEEEMLNFIGRIPKATIAHQCWRETLKQVKSGDVVYCDPPYVPVGKTRSFPYTPNGKPFDNAEQEEFVQTIESLLSTTPNISVIVSNHDLNYTRQLYRNADEVVSFAASRKIGCTVKSRGSKLELLAIYRN